MSKEESNKTRATQTSPMGTRGSFFGLWLDVNHSRQWLGANMSMFMSKCESCSYLVANHSACPNCGHIGNSDGSEECVIEEFARRRALHNRNSTIMMAAKLVGGGFALLGSGGAVWGRMARSAAGPRRLEQRVADVEGSAVNFEALLIVGLVIVCIFVAVTAYLLFMKAAETRLPVGLCCPKCDERLDELNIDYSQCPACSVHLC